jgi:glycosyltransferase involved in cell wall biosynthesis
MRNLTLALILPLVIFFSFFSRFFNIRKGIGIGPEPLINNLFHKKALQKFNYDAETFSVGSYFITNKFDHVFEFPLCSYYSLLRSLFVYECLYMYFNGCLIFKNSIFENIEPYIFKIAGVKTVIMPYGSDVQDLSRSNNLLYKNAVFKDYPEYRFDDKNIASRIFKWQINASHIISGCDWVDYMTFWDTLMISHFAIDTDEIKPSFYNISSDPIKIIHAPNHQNIKGSNFLIGAVEELIKEGYQIDFELLEKIPNEKLKEKISNCDILLDQLIVGWYAMTAIEAMAFGKPVLCYLREDLENLFIGEGLIKKNEIPIIKADTSNIKEVLKNLIENRSDLREIGLRSRDYVELHHSLHFIGSCFQEINLKIGVHSS